jgi:S1-C subfamily serine protease
MQDGLRRRDTNKPTFRGSILDADPPAQGVKIARRLTPDFTVPLPGQPGAFPTGVTATLDSLGTDVGSTVAAGSAFLKDYTSNVGTRGARDIAVYRATSPAVVLVVTKDGFGSGSLLDNKTILTNWHMVTGYRQVNVIFKPTDPFGKLSDDDLVAAQVIKTDARHDLALLRPKAVPSHSITPIKVAPQDNIEIGADVHAIGHPTGETWTYNNWNRQPDST